MNWNVHELQRRTTLFNQTIFVYTAHKVNVVVVSTIGEYGLRYCHRISGFYALSGGFIAFIGIC